MKAPTTVLCLIIFVLTACEAKPVTHKDSEQTTQIRENGLKPGLWILTTKMPHAAYGTTAKICLENLSKADVIQQMIVSEVEQTNCEDRKVQHLAGEANVSVVCKTNAGEVNLALRLIADSPIAFRQIVTATMDGKPFLDGGSETIASWSGDCPKDLTDGYMLMDNGTKQKMW